MKQLFTFLKISLGDKKIRLSLSATLLVVISLCLVSFQSKEVSVPLGPTGEPLSATDELIPPGFVMVPLELQNKEALHSLVGSFAVVDLFTVSPDGQKKGIRVGRRLKLVRSPNDADQFSALIEEEQAPTLFLHPGPLFAVVQSRKAQGSSMSKIQSSVSRIHTYSSEQK